MNTEALALRTGWFNRLVHAWRTLYRDRIGPRHAPAPRSRHVRIAGLK